MKPTHMAVCAWLAAGCWGSNRGEVTVSSPELMSASPGVQVVADADEPLFFVDGSYYLYRDGSWLRSESYRGGFARIDVVPPQLRVLPQPDAFAHYRRNQGRAATLRGALQPTPPPPVEEPNPQTRPMPSDPMPQPQVPDKATAPRPPDN